MSGRPKPPTSALGRGRDVAVWWVANTVLRCGSPWFQAMIEGSIKRGLRAAAEDAKPDLMTEPTRHSGPLLKWELRIWGDGDVVQGGKCSAGALAKILRQHADELRRRSVPDESGGVG